MSLFIFQFAQRILPVHHGKLFVDFCEQVLVCICSSLLEDSPEMGIFILKLGIYRK